MPLPGNISLVQVTGPIVDDQGNGLTGTLEFTSSIGHLIAPDGLVAPAYRRLSVTNGVFSYGFIPADAAGIQPKSWTWHVRFTSLDQSLSFEFDVMVPSTGPVTLGSIASVPSVGQVIMLSNGDGGSSNVSAVDNGTYVTLTVS